MATILVEVLADAKQFKAEMGSVAAETDAANGSLAKLGKATMLVGAALAGGVVFGLVKSVEAATKFQSSMELIQTQAGGSAKEVDTMSKALLGMASSVGQTPEQLSQALYHIESSGYRGAQALSILKLAAEGAAVGHADLTQTTNALVGAERTGIKGLGDMSHAMGTLNAIVGAGNMTMDQLTSALGTGVLVTAKAFGLSIQDVGSSLATMTSNGVPAVNAASALKMMFASLAAPTKAAQGALKSIGLSSSDLATTMRSQGLGPALTELKQHMMDAGLNATQTAALLTTAFGKKSSGGLLTLLGNLSDLKKATAQVSDGAKSFGANWAETQKSAEFASARFHAALSAIEIEIGSTLLPIVTRFTNWLTEELPVAIAAAKGAIAFLTPYFNQLKGVLEQVGAKFEEIGGKVKQAVDAFMQMKGHSDAIKAALAVLAIGIGAVTIATIAMNLAMLANPVVLLVVAIAALAAGLVLAYENSATFRNIVNTAFADIKAVAIPVMQWLEQNVPPIFDDIRAKAEEAFGWLKVNVPPAWVVIKTAVQEVIAWLVANVPPAFLAVISAVEATTNWLLTNVPAAFNSVYSFVSQALADIEAVVKTVWPIIKATFDLYLGAIKVSFDALWSPFVTIVDGALNAVKETVKTITHDIADVIEIFSSLLHGNWEGAWNGLEALVTDTLNGVVSINRTILGSLATAVLQLATNVAHAIWNGLKQVVQFISGLGADLLTAIGHGITDAATGALTEAEKIGRDIVTGAVNGLAGLATALRTKIQGTLSSVLSSIDVPGFSPPAHAASQAIGQPLAQGTIDGWLMGSAALPAAMTKSLQAAITAGRTVIQAAGSAFQTAWGQLASGADSALGTMQASISTKTEKIIAALQAAGQKAQLTASLTAAKSQLASAKAGPAGPTPAEQALAALQASQAGKSGAPQTANEAALAAIQDAHDEASRNQALSAAQTQLSTAQSGGDPATILAAQQQLADAQYNIQVAGLNKQIAADTAAAATKTAADTAAYNAQVTSLQNEIAAEQAAATQKAAIATAQDAVTSAQAAIASAAKSARLQKEADEERIQLNARNTLQKTHFDAALTTLQNHLAKGHDTYAEAQKAILKLFKTFGVNYSDAGAELGAAFVTGLKQSIQGAAGKSGALSGKLDDVAAGINVPHAATGGFVAQTGLAVIHQGENIIPAGQGSGNVYVSITGMVGDDQVEQLRNIIIRKGRNTTGGAFGGYG